MNAFFLTYTIAWMLFCALAAGIAFKHRELPSAEGLEYIRFLSVPWKLIVFAVAFLFVTFAGHFTDDETWDIVTGGVMSLLTFFTAP